MKHTADDFQQRTGIHLWPYQVADAERMAAGHFGCFQDTGLGKTFTALAAILKMEGHTCAGPVIWIGPRLSLAMIEENILKVWPHATITTVRSAKDVKKVFRQPFILVTSDLIRNATVREALIRVGAETVIVDEAHRFKSHSAARTRALYGEDLDGTGGVIQGASRVWLLSGTPMPNGLPGELYAHLHALWPLSIPATRKDGPQSFWQFRNNYHHLSAMIVGGRRVWVDRGAKNLVEFKARTTGCWVRRKIEDYLDLEAPIIEETVLEWYGEVAGADTPGTVDTLLPDEIRAVLEARDRPADQVLEALSQQQIATAMRLTGTLKVQPTVALIEQLLEEGAEQILVGFWHHDVGNAIASELMVEGEQSFLIHGGTPAITANNIIKEFQAGNTRLLVGQIAAMGEAHNLQNCHHVVLAEQSWVPGQNKQFIARCHRQGQKSRVIAHSVIIKGSLDENVCRALTRKISDQTQAMESDIEAHAEQVVA